MLLRAVRLGTVERRRHVVHRGVRCYVRRLRVLVICGETGVVLPIGSVCVARRLTCGCARVHAYSP